MCVELLYETPVNLVVTAARTCYNSFNKQLPDRDIELLKNLVKLEHLSVFEHKIFTFRITGISRGCLQELVRHRIASYSVRSTRFTLKQLKNVELSPKNYGNYIKLIGVPEVDELNIKQLIELQNLCKSELKNDILKYTLPEAFLTELVLTINFRSLLNFFKLRMATNAHFEIRELAQTIYNIVKNTDVGFLLDTSN